MADYPANAAGPVYWPEPKDPDDVKDYGFDWALELAGDSPDDTISSYTVTVSSGLTRDSDSRTGAVITAWLSGGTAGREYNVLCRVVTANGRTLDRTGIVRVRTR